MNHDNAHCLDYIKREDAKRVLNKGLRYMRAFGVNRCLPMIYEVPSADVRENVKGMWVKVVDRTEMYDKEGVKTWGMLFQCNQCGFVLNAIEGHTGQYNFCPNCGADMRGDNNEMDSMQ